MPKKAGDGTDTKGLLDYLHGPGKRDEHTNPHMVASWDDPFVEYPARSPHMTISDLALILDVPVHALPGKRPAMHVYHVAVRNAPEDRLLTDEEWARVAREMMHASGIAPHGDDQGCRWVAIRHADDHIHIVATQARQDGRQPRLRQDIPKMHAAAREFEVEFGLRRLKLRSRLCRVLSAACCPPSGDVRRVVFHARGPAHCGRHAVLAQQAGRPSGARAPGPGDRGSAPEP